jgi:hypothetical protein
LFVIQDQALKKAEGQSSSAYQFTSRTGGVNEAVKYIYMIDSNLGGNKKGQVKNKFDLSLKVVLPVQFSNLFIMDLKRLAGLVA